MLLDINLLRWKFGRTYNYRIVWGQYEVTGTNYYLGPLKLTVD